MTNVLSTISQHFGKTLILGAFLPTLVFVVFGLTILVPWLPPESALIAQAKAIENLDTKDLVVLSLITVVLSGLLHNLNIPIMRVYEGYPWKDSLLGQWLTDRYKKQFDRLNARLEGMRVVRDILNAESHKDATEFSSRVDRINLRLANEFPSKRPSILPTRFGNVMRSFEDYPRRQYGISAITLWPRLIGKIDKEYAATIDDSKTSLDFMMNGAALSGLFSMLVLVLGLIYRTPFNSKGRFSLWLAEIVVFAVLSHVLYRGSISRAAAYGAKVKAAFDLYRWELLKQFGYTRTPTNVADEHALWENISMFMIYGTPPKKRARLANYSSSTAAMDNSPTMMIDTARGVTLSNSTTGEITITIMITNVSEKKAAKEVVITDSLPAGYEYVWNSANVDQGEVKVTGSNPFRFGLKPELPAGETRTLEYKAVLLKKP